MRRSFLPAFLLLLPGLPGLSLAATAASAVASTVPSAGPPLVTPAQPHPAVPPMDAIYLCVDTDGRKTYQNSPDGTSCRRIDGLVASIPATDLGRSRLPRAVSTRPGISPASFPRIDINTQRSRDSDRRRILEEEMRTEQERLARLRAEFNQGRPQPATDEIVGSSRYLDHVQRLYEDIERSEGNIASLQRELTPVRY